MVKNIVRALVMSGVIAVLDHVNAGGPGGRTWRGLRLSPGAPDKDGVFWKYGPHLRSTYSPTRLPTKSFWLVTVRWGHSPFANSARTKRPHSLSAVAGAASAQVFESWPEAGVFRFEDGSLLTVTVTEGVLCVDLDHRGGPPN